MANLQQTFADETITREEWTWVRDLISEVQRDERRDTFARCLFQWDLAVRQFRKLERRKLLIQPPTEADLHYHALCLHALLAIGHALVIESGKFKPEELALLAVNADEVRAYVAELEQSFREWHHGFSAAEVHAAQESIFGAKA